MLIIPGGFTFNALILSTTTVVVQLFRLSLIHCTDTQASISHTCRLQYTLTISLHFCVQRSPWKLLIFPNGVRTRFLYSEVNGSWKLVRSRARTLVLKYQSFRLLETFWEEISIPRVVYWCGGQSRWRLVAEGLNIFPWGAMEEVVVASWLASLQAIFHNLFLRRLMVSSVFQLFLEFYEIFSAK